MLQIKFDHFDVFLLENVESVEGEEQQLVLLAELALDELFLVDDGVRFEFFEPSKSWDCEKFSF